MPTQKVYRLTRRTSPEDLQIFEEEIPSISNHEVLIRVHAVALNYRDIAIATSAYPFFVKDQVVPCSDAAGEIVEVGSAVTKGLTKGDGVVCTFDPTHLYGPKIHPANGQGGPVDGVLRQYIALPAEGVVKIPSHSFLSYAQWATLAASGTTAWNALYGNVPLRPGQTVLFQGTGGVSILGLIIAKAAGAITIMTSSSNEKLEVVKEKYGADYTINYKTAPDWAEEVLQVTNGRGADHILEVGGGGTIEQSLKAVTMGGVVSVVGFLAGPSRLDKPDFPMLVLSKGAIVRGINLGPVGMTEDLVNFVGQKRLVVPVDRTFGFSREEVLRAYDYLGGKERIGKVCIIVQ